MDVKNEKVIEKLNIKYANAVLETNEFRGELTIIISKEHIVEVCRFLKEDEELAFDLLADLCGIDMNTPENRFGVIYNLYSLKNKHRIRLKMLGTLCRPAEGRVHVCQHFCVDA